MPAFADGWVDDVLDFWFGELGRDGWFRKDEQLDKAIATRFGAVYEAVAARPIAELTADANAALAAVIVLDQFPRNMFRGTPQAFATDARARELSNAAIGKNIDSETPVERRVFFYLPFEHSEDAGDQARSVELTAKLGDREFTRYAQAHADVIGRFNRFPHRNAILGRQSTPEEIAYLAEPGSGF